MSKLSLVICYRNKVTQDGHLTNTDSRPGVIHNGRVLMRCPGKTNCSAHVIDTQALETGILA